MCDFCNKLGFSVECVVLSEHTPLKKVSCGAVFEKVNYGKLKGYDPQKITQTIGLITKNPDINHASSNYKEHWTLIKQKISKEELRNSLFTIPVSTTASTFSTVTSQLDQQTRPDQPNVIKKTNC